MTMNNCVIIECGHEFINVMHKHCNESFWKRTMKASDILDGNLDSELDSVCANPKGQLVTVFEESWWKRKPLDPTENPNVASTEFATLMTMTMHGNKWGWQKTCAPWIVKWSLLMKGHFANQRNKDIKSWKRPSVSQWKKPKKDNGLHGDDTQWKGPFV